MEPGLNRQKAIDFFTQRSNQLLKKALASSSEELSPEDCLTSLLDFHKTSIQNNTENSKEHELKLLYIIYKYGKKVPSGTYIKDAEVLLSKETKESLHFLMTQRKFVDSS